MAKFDGEASYSIAAVSKLTGVSCHALRVWERRYQFPVPGRSPSGHRRFSAEQVGQVRRIAEFARGGAAIGDLIEGVRTGKIQLNPPESDSSPALGSRTLVESLVDRLTKADIVGADATYDELMIGMSPMELIARVINPGLTDIGDRWFRHECSIFQERTVTSFLRRKLDHMFELARCANPNPRRRALVGTVQGDQHHGGVLMFSIMLELAGWRAIELGVDLPVSEYHKAVIAWRPDAIGLSFVLSRNINKRFQELSQIREVPIFVGGRSILNYQGLAKKHGLIPLCGSFSDSVRVFQDEFEAWSQKRSDPSR